MGDATNIEAESFVLPPDYNSETFIRDNSYKPENAREAQAIGIELQRLYGAISLHQFDPDTTNAALHGIVDHIGHMPDDLSVRDITPLSVVARALGDSSSPLLALGSEDRSKAINIAAQAELDRLKRNEGKGTPYDGPPQILDFSPRERKPGERPFATVQGSYATRTAELRVAMKAPVAPKK